MQHSGVLVTEWPIILGCEASGVVVEIGDGVTKFKPGDYVFGCTRLGYNKHSTFQQTFVMDEDITIKKSPNLSVEEASTLGVALKVGNQELKWLSRSQATVLIRCCV
jgi:NADPH:quinone reductase-like Zn-dependent oxidoreductase